MDKRGYLCPAERSEKLREYFDLCKANDLTDEPQQAYNGMSVYNPGSNSAGIVSTNDGLAQAFNNLSIYNAGPGHIGKPNSGAAVPFPGNGPRLNNPTYYSLGDGRVFFSGSSNGQGIFQRGGTSFGVHQQSPYAQQPIPQNGSTQQGTVQGAIWNGGQQAQPVEVPDLAAPRRTSLSSNEENGPQTPFFGAHTAGFYSKITVPDNSPQTWTTPSPQQLGHSVAIQAQPLWRDSEQKQYIIKDLDAICSEEPAIPRPIPAIFSDDKARGTLETSLENKIHTTNVYIRGLHPNTTDEMLVAYGARFGLISSAKSMIDQQNGLCKGLVIQGH